MRDSSTILVEKG